MSKKVGEKKVVIQGNPGRGVQIHREGKKDEQKPLAQILDGKRGPRGVEILDHRPQDG
jgi:hypothetical protein